MAADPRWRNYCFILALAAKRYDKRAISYLFLPTAVQMLSF